MPKMPNVISGEEVETEWGNDIRDRTLQRYADATERAASNPTPQAGEFSYLGNPGILSYYHAGVWKEVRPATEYLPLAGGVMTGPTLIPNGTAALPAIGFASDPDTGLFKPTADAIGFAAAGAERFRIDPTRFISLGGTGSPQVNYAAGVAATPAYAFSGDADTGLYRAGADILGFAAGGAERARIDATRLVMGGGTGAGQLNTGPFGPTNPAFTFNGEDNLGFYRSAAGVIGVAIGGVKTFEFNGISIGGFGSPGYTTASGFTEDEKVGMTWAGPSDGGILVAIRQAGASGFFGRLSNGGVLDFRRSGIQVGSVAVTSTGTTYNTTSDERLKENIADLDGAEALSLLGALRTRSFTWKATGQEDVGLIAQEVESVYPTVVHHPDPPMAGEAAGFLSLDYGRFTPLLIAAVQTLSARLEAAEAKLAEAGGTT